MNQTTAKKKMKEISKVKDCNISINILSKSQQPESWEEIKVKYTLTVGL